MGIAVERRRRESETERERVKAKKRKRERGRDRVSLSGRDRDPVLLPASPLLVFPGPGCLPSEFHSSQMMPRSNLLGTYETQERRGHPDYRAVQLRLTSHQ